MYDCLRIKINAEDSKIVPYGGVGSHRDAGRGRSGTPVPLQRFLVNMY